jgi:hypothetical protein
MEGKRNQFILTFMINFLQSSMKITHNIQYNGGYITHNEQDRGCLGDGPENTTL